jgi:hypothetical protein
LPALSSGHGTGCDPSAIFCSDTVAPAATASDGSIWNVA